MAITVKPITAADLAAMESQKMIREVVEGQWVEADENMTGKRHGRIEAMIIFLLMSYVLPRKLGHIYPGDTTFVIEGTPENIQTIRMPDVSFVAAGREDEQNPDEAHYLAPDLAIEIISPSERYNEIRAKLDDYFRAGVRQVWQILPELQEVVVNFPDGTARTYHADQKIPGGDILPEFELSVADIFAE
jgi:Uma2 family endonuclease